jgi:hypothetical protein
LSEFLDVEYSHPFVTILSGDRFIEVLLGQ